ncbi:hypothetical protein NLI96_g11898 [Meripilus lineatus]|uniref:Uncharacterized protein n=1 Tax=Meripilus lineatus TaxID=2056292 RepID=A0AAD5USC8_9APHY|nr:hypothetical protein NLI96_g11898 [Physisporinus lineatus]
MDNDPEAELVRTFFENTWTHNSNVPRVEAVWKIYMSVEITHAFWDYRNLLIVKADEYYKSLWTENSPQRVILLNNVVMGNAMKLQSNRKGLIRVGKLLLRTKTSQLTAYKPPDGYHSVVGEPGNILSYPEAVVYDEHAILPIYLVTYVPSVDRFGENALLSAQPSRALVRQAIKC